MPRTRRDARPARARAHREARAHSRLGSPRSRRAAPAPPSDSRAARASTASRTVAGTVWPSVASASVTKNGFPPVRAYSSSASTPCGAANSATAALRERVDRDPSGCADDLAKHDPQPVRAVELIVSVAGEHQRGSRRDAGADQRQYVDRGLVGPVQILQHQHRRSPAAKLAKQCRRDLVRPLRQPRRRARTRPPVVSATSSNGPSGRGVRSGAHAPHITRPEPAMSRQKRSSIAVLPAPASPPTSTSRPAEPARTSLSSSANAARCDSRSSSASPSRARTRVRHDRGQSPTHRSDRRAGRPTPGPASRVRLWQHGAYAGDGSSSPPRRPRRGARSPRPRRFRHRPTGSLPTRSPSGCCTTVTTRAGGLVCTALPDRRTAEPAHPPGARPRSRPQRPETNA